MPEAKTQSLAAKLAEIMGQMKHVKKEGFNKAQNYKFVRETDVAEMASELLAAKGIWVHQTLIAEDMEPLYTTNSGAQMWLTKVQIAFKFIDGATLEETLPQTFSGHGADTGDKGIYKAMTGAEKYFLMKSFLISTGDDPEADEKVDKAADAAGAATAPRVVRGSQTGVQRGGRSDAATAAQVNEVARLVKELNLTAETALPIIQAVLGEIPADKQNMRDFLGSKKSAEVGKLIEALMEFKPVEASDEPVEAGSDEPPAAMAVV
jgi:hypothetical protein